MSDKGLYWITFDSTEQHIWLLSVVNAYNRVVDRGVYDDVVITFDDSIDVQSVKPFHLVTLACLIHHINKMGHHVYVSSKNKYLTDYLFNDLGFQEYFGGGKNYVETKTSSNIFNLWRIVESDKDMYAKKVEDYFRSRYFHDKDLSAISLCMVEAYYNVFDHADANGNAFSIIQYDKASSRLYVAISDFGIGVAQSVRRHNNVCSDRDAVKMAVEDGFTVSSTERNRGMGLGNIFSMTDEVMLISNRGMISKKHDGKLEPVGLDFIYPGTLVCFEIDLSSMEDEEIIEEFNI